MTRLPAETTGPQADAARGLAEAAEAGDAAAIESLLAAGVPADSTLPNGETPLMRAASRGHEAAARLLLDGGADVDARRADGFTPLILAVFFGHAGVSRLLLERGADADAGTRFGTTAKTWAAARGFDEISALFESAGPGPLPADADEERTHQTPPRRPKPPAAPATSHARGGRDGSAPRVRAGDAEPEVRARASEASLIFGHTPGAESAVEAVGTKIAEATSAARPEQSLGGEAGTGEATGREKDHAAHAAQSGPLFTAFQPPRRDSSWRPAARLVVLVVVCASAVYAAWYWTRTDGEAGRVTISPQDASPQPAAPLTSATPSVAAEQPSLDIAPQNTQSVPPPAAAGAGANAPYFTSDPAYRQPVLTNPSAGRSTPPALVSGGETNATDSPAATPEGEGSARSSRRAGDEPPAGDSGSPETPRRGNDARANEQSQAASPPVPTAAPPPRPAPTAAAEPTPTPRRRVIQWPPQ